MFLSLGSGCYVSYFTHSGLGSKGKDEAEGADEPKTRPKAATSQQLAEGEEGEAFKSLMMDAPTGLGRGTHQDLLRFVGCGDEGFSSAKVDQLVDLAQLQMASGFGYQIITDNIQEEGNRQAVRSRIQALLVTSAAPKVALPLPAALAQVVGRDAIGTLVSLPAVMDKLNALNDTVVKLQNIVVPAPHPVANIIEEKKKTGRGHSTVYAHGGFSWFKVRLCQSSLLALCL